MTLTEIEKVIDEANVVGVFSEWGGTPNWFPVDDNWRKYEKEEYRHANDKDYPQAYMDGDVKCYYKLNKSTGEMTLLAQVDHIDKEKKIVKKKIDEMTKEEINLVQSKLCEGRRTCNNCPFYADHETACLVYFPSWKKLYEENKDKEFEVEVEK